MKTSRNGLALVLLATPAFAQSPPASPPGPGLDDWLDWKTMTGDWDGLRPELEQDGIVLRGHYVNEAAGNPVGGASRAVRIPAKLC